MRPGCRNLALAGLLLVVIGLSACGRKDDLYLPDEEREKDRERSALIRQNFSA